MLENWNKVVDYPDYIVSPQGVVINKNTGQMMKSSIAMGGRRKVSVTNPRGTRQIPHDKAVWEAYNGRLPAGKVIEHIDGDRGNNKLSNLRLADRQRRPHVKVVNIDTGELFETMSAAAHSIGVPKGIISYAVRTPDRRVNGHRFEIAS